MDFDSLPETLEMNHEEKQETAHQRISEADEMLELELEGELEEVSVADLDYEVNAVTIPTMEGSRVVFDSTNFFRKEYEEQVDIATEEALHVKQQNGTFSDWLIDRHGAYGLADEFSGPRYRRDLEGEAELVLNELLEHGTSYPYFRDLKESELERKEIEPESELSEDIDSFYHGAIEAAVEEYGLEAGDVYTGNG
ncbi:MAG: hypothetical protein ABEJ66_02650, partial [Candidatus Nanohaloarchaea archaeon]